MSICPCGAEIDQLPVGRKRKYCSACSPIKRSNAQRKPHDTNCVVCGKNTSGQQLCSDKCKWLNRRRKSCVQCGQPSGWSHSDKRADNVICTSCRKKNNPRPKPQALTWSCQMCGNVKTRPPTKGQVPKYCGKSCEQLAAFYRRRARLRDAFVEEVNRAEVFITDGYRCHLCGCMTDKTKSYPHPKSPTLDHVIPISKGGLHERENCRTACARCNSAKQDRGGGEQFALVF